jgi:hypothetical protein
VKEALVQNQVVEITLRDSTTWTSHFCGKMADHVTNFGARLEWTRRRNRLMEYETDLGRGWRRVHPLANGEVKHLSEEEERIAQKMGIK